MKEKLKNISKRMKVLFGYGILVSLLAGFIMFLGFVLALIVGGEAAAKICEFLYKVLGPIMIYISTIMVVWGLICMYLAGEVELTAKKK